MGRGFHESFPGSPGGGWPPLFRGLSSSAATCVGQARFLPKGPPLPPSICWPDPELRPRGLLKQFCLERDGYAPPITVCLMSRKVCGWHISPLQDLGG